MGFFSRRTTATCPVCDAPLERNMALHNLDHVIAAPDGEPGFAWRCGCGEQDGVWDGKVGAAAALTMHMRDRHGIAPM
jgi:hypothetical protein